MFRILLLLQYVTLATVLLAGALWMAGELLGREGLIERLTGWALVIGPLLGILAWLTIEPAVLRRMVTTSISAASGSAGVILVPSANAVSAVVRAFPPADGPLAERVNQADSFLRSVERLVAVRTAEGIELRSGIHGTRVLSRLNPGEYLVEPRDSGSVLTVRLADGRRVASFPVKTPRGLMLVSASYSVAAAALSEER